MAVTTPSAELTVPDVVTSWLAAVRPGGAENAFELISGADWKSFSFYSDDICTVVFDGELHNREQLIREFGLGMTEADDARLVAHLFATIGPGFLRRLSGAYAIVVWDSRTNEAWLIRDRMGVHPLFLSDADGSILVSDSIETLLRHPAVPRTLDRVLLALHCWPSWIEDKEQTFYEAIKRLPAGNSMRVRATGVETRRYWDPAPPDREVEWIVEDGVERFELALAEAVRRCVVRGPAAICLSGGLDSISIASFAAEVAAEQGLSAPWALSVEFPDPDNMQEADVQRAVAAQLGMPQVMMTLHDALGRRPLLPAALELSRTWPVPLLGIFSPAYFTLIEEARRNGCEVVMTGAGGDNWLSVCLEYAADLIWSLDYRGLYRLWNTYQRSYRVPRWLVLRRMLWRYGVRNVLSSFEQRLLLRTRPSLLLTQTRWRVERSLPAWLAPDPEVRAALRAQAERVKMRPKPKPGEFYVNEIRRGIDHPIVSLELEETFEKGRRLDAPILMPYHDADLVDLLCRTPPEILTMGDRSKSMVRRSMASRIAGLGVERQKKITTGNFWPNKAGEAIDAWNSLGGAPALAELGIVDGTLIDREVRKMLAENEQGFVPYVWEILDHEAWVRERL